MIYLSVLKNIKQYSVASTNLDEKFINPARREAQEVNYQEIVGTQLYNKLLQLVKNGETGYPQNNYYRELLNLSQFFFIYSTLANLTISATFKFNNIGLNTAYDDNVNIPSIKDIFQIRKYYQDKANDEISKITNYLKENKEHFPELKTNKCWETQPTLNDKTNCSIFLGGRRGKLL